MVSDAYEHPPISPHVIERDVDDGTPRPFNREVIHMCMVLAAIILDQDSNKITLPDLFAETRKTYGHLTTWTDQQLLEVLESMHEICAADAEHLEQLGLRKAKRAEPSISPETRPDL